MAIQNGVIIMTFMHLKSNYSVRIASKER